MNAGANQLGLSDFGVVAMVSHRQTQPAEVSTQETRREEETQKEAAISVPLKPEKEVLLPGNFSVSPRTCCLSSYEIPYIFT